jgi:hypothetical protein
MEPLTGDEMFQTGFGKALTQLIPGWDERNIERLIIDIPAGAAVRVYYQERADRRMLDLDWTAGLRGAEVVSVKDKEPALAEPQQAEPTLPVYYRFTGTGRAFAGPLVLNDPTEIIASRLPTRLLKVGQAYQGWRITRGGMEYLNLINIGLENIRFNPAYFEEL